MAEETAVKYRKGHDTQYKIDRYTYSVSSYYMKDNAPSAKDRVESMIRERTIHTIAGSAR
jgi:hypothetical protein